VNLVALRRLHGVQRDELRRDILGLSLVAATEPLDPFLRQGCLLVPDVEQPSTWEAVHRTGERSALEIKDGALPAYASAAAKRFGVGEDREFQFDKALARNDAKKKDKK
jgi:CRISPR-associated protein Csb1